MPTPLRPGKRAAADARASGLASARLADPAGPTRSLDQLAKSVATGAQLIDPAVGQGLRAAAQREHGAPRIADARGEDPERTRVAEIEPPPNSLAAVSPLGEHAYVGAKQLERLNDT